MENTETLTLQDLMIIRDSIAAAAQRGAFKADEMSTIGPAYDRLNNWVTKTQSDLAEQSNTDEESEQTQGE